MVNLYRYRGKNDYLILCWFWNGTSPLHGTARFSTVHFWGSFHCVQVPGKPGNFFSSTSVEKSTKEITCVLSKRLPSHSTDSNHNTFIRRFYSKRLTIAFRLYIFNQYVCSLGIEPTTFCTADAMLYHWATPEHNEVLWEISHAQHQNQPPQHTRSAPVCILPKLLYG